MTLWKNNFHYLGVSYIKFFTDLYIMGTLEVTYSFHKPVFLSGSSSAFVMCNDDPISILKTFVGALFIRYHLIMWASLITEVHLRHI